MPTIESYSFGHMVINGESFRKDVIIFPDGSILSPWWRREGHVLAPADLQELLAAEPEIIICGTGAMGVMQPMAGLPQDLQNRDIEFMAFKTARAVETYNSLSGGKKRVGACFHLTC